MDKQLLSCSLKRENAVKMVAAATLDDEKVKLQIVYSELIGGGCYGEVCKAKLVKSGQTVAVKQIKKHPDDTPELKMMRKMNHQNIVKLKYFFYSSGDKKQELYVNLILEYAPTTVYRVARQYSKQRTPIPMILVQLYMYQLFQSLGYINSVKICHRDIKPQNLLIYQESGVLKLCDFGSARYLVPNEPDASNIEPNFSYIDTNVSYIEPNVSCSRYYRAPELIFGATNYTNSIDVWSAGTVMAELLLGHPVFQGESDVDQIVEIMKFLGTPSRKQVLSMNPNYKEFKFPQINAFHWTNTFPRNTTPEALDLLRRILRFDPTSREIPQNALKHVIFDELRKPNATLPSGRPLPLSSDDLQKDLLTTRNRTSEIPPESVQRFKRRQTTPTSKDANNKLGSKRQNIVEKTEPKPPSVQARKSLFRQALDFQVEPNKLNHEMSRLKGEELRRRLNDAQMKCSPSEAVDEMLQFLRVKSAVDQWGVLLKKHTDGDSTSLVNTEEGIFLEVSTSLIEDKQKLLKIFIQRIIQEIALRDRIDTLQCGRLIRLFCNAVKIAEVVPTPSENPDDDPEVYKALVSEKKSSWMRRLFEKLLVNHPTQLVKSVAYCLISEVAEYCKFLGDETNPARSEFNIAFRILVYRDSEQTGVITWLFNKKWKLKFPDQPTSKGIRNAFRMAHRNYVAGDSDLKKSIYLSKTASPELLKVALHMLKNQMTQMKQQFFEPKEKDKELKHIQFPKQMTAEKAVEMKRKSVWQKTVLELLKGPANSRCWEEIRIVLEDNYRQMITAHNIIHSQTVFQYVDGYGVDSIRESVKHLMALISEFTKFPLEPSILPTSSNSTSHNSVPSTSSN